MSKIIKLVESNPKAQKPRFSEVPLEINLGPAPLEKLAIFRKPDGTEYHLYGKVVGIKRADGTFEIEHTTLQLKEIQTKKLPKRQVSG